MNKITGNLAVKAITIVLLIAAVITMVASGIGLIISIDRNYFELGREEAKTYWVQRIADQMSVKSFYFNYSRDNNEENIVNNGDRLPGTNFYFEIKDSTGKLVAGSKPEFTPYYSSVEEVRDSGWYYDNESGKDVEYDSGKF